MTESEIIVDFLVFCAFVWLMVSAHLKIRKLRQEQEKIRAEWTAVLELLKRK